MNIQATPWTPKFQGLLVTAFDNDRQEWLHHTSTLFLSEEFDNYQLLFYDGRNKREVLDSKPLKLPRIMYFGDDYRIPPFIDYVKKSDEEMNKHPHFKKFFAMVTDVFDSQFQITNQDYYSHRIKLIPEQVLIYPTGDGKYEVFTPTQYSDYKMKNPQGTKFRHLENNPTIHRNFLLDNNLKFNDYGFQANESHTVNLDDYQTLRENSGIFNLRIYSPIFGLVLGGDNKFYPGEEAILSVHMRSIKQSTPEETFYYYFIINGTTYPTKNIYFPEREMIYLYQRFRVPWTLGPLDVRLCTSDGCTDVNATVEPLEKEVPPNTRSDNLKRMLVVEPSTPAYGIDRVTYPEYKLGDEIRRGYYYFDIVERSCHLVPEGSGKVYFDPDRPQVKEKKGEGKLKSGYGFGFQFPQNIVDNYSNYNNNECVSTQKLMVSFPEFEYKEYFRILEKIDGFWQFAVNSFHPRKRRIHFTPLNYPNDDYTIKVEHLGVYTPRGRAYLHETYTFPIYGNLWDDYQVEVTSGWSK